MLLNAAGQAAEQEWLRTGKLRQNVQLHEFVVMPDHFHGIVEILDYGHGRYALPGGDRDALQCVSTGKQFGPQKDNLASIIRGFKSSVVRAVRKLNPDFAWQTRFHDRIVRDNDALERIRNYIQENPAKWKTDDYYDNVDTHCDASLRKNLN